MNSIQDGLWKEICECVRSVSPESYVGYKRTDLVSVHYPIGIAILGWRSLLIFTETRPSSGIGFEICQSSYGQGKTEWLTVADRNERVRRPLVCALVRVERTVTQRVKEFRQLEVPLYTS